MRRVLLVGFLLFLVSCGSHSSKESKKIDENNMITDSTINSQLSGFEKKDNEISYLNDFEKYPALNYFKKSPIVNTPKTKKPEVTIKPIEQKPEPQKTQGSIQKISTRQANGTSLVSQKGWISNEFNFNYLKYDLIGTCDPNNELNVSFFEISEGKRINSSYSSLVCQDGKFSAGKRYSVEGNGPFKIYYEFTDDNDNVVMTGSSREFSADGKVAEGW